MARLSNCMKYDLAQIKKRFLEEVRKYNAAPFHLNYSKPCLHCGKTFVGKDWRFNETSFCSEECERALRGKLDPYTNYEVKLFWKFFGKDIRLLEDI